MTAEKITLKNGKLSVPNHPIIPFIMGDGSGPDIWRAAVRVFDASIKKAYGDTRKIEWREVLAGQKSFNHTGVWLPQETVDAIHENLVVIKCPLTMPLGGGIRSLNVALRQKFDMYAFLRSIKHFPGIPVPVIHPEKIDMVVFRENTEGIYTGIEAEASSEKSAKILDFLAKEFPQDFSKIRFGSQKKVSEFGRLRGRNEPDTTQVGIGIKTVSRQGSERLIRAAIQYAIDHGRKSVTMVHNGNLMKFTEGSFKSWAYELAEREFRGQVHTRAQYELTAATEGREAANTEREAAQAAGKILVKDAIANIAFQQIITRPESFDVIAALNQNGDYLSDILSALVGGRGILPVANINYVTGHALFEATHGTSRQFTDRDLANPIAVILAGTMMLQYLDWKKASEMITRAVESVIGSKRVTHDLHKIIEGATKLKTSEFADAIIKEME